MQKAKASKENDDAEKKGWAGGWVGGNVPPRINWLLGRRKNNF